MCMTPWERTDKKVGCTYTHECGRCPECTSRRVSGWSFRLMTESKRAASAHFITLTYADGKATRTKNGYLNLSKRHIQLFLKRLRKANQHNNYPPIRYYAAGEYGGKTWRPHYHLIVFNADINTFQPAWPDGAIHYGSVSGASIGYTLKYISKSSRIPYHKNDDREKEFALMSKGLGSNYLTPSMIKWHKDDLENRMYINIEDGKKITMPRYFKDKVYSIEERKKIANESAYQAEKRRLAFEQDKDFDKKFRDREAGIKAAFENASHKQFKNDKL